MKTKLITMMLLLLVCTISFSQNKKTSELKIKTSAECDKCKKKIESNLVYEKGVKFCSLDVPSKILSVKYNSEKTSPEKIRNAVGKLGYDADEVLADSSAYSNLPACCKKGGLNHKD